MDVRIVPNIRADPADRLALVGAKDRNVWCVASPREPNVVTAGQERASQPLADEAATTSHERSTSHRRFRRGQQRCRIEALASRAKR
jgi:hypothetical protein